MTEQAIDTGLSPADELEMLKDRATKMNIPFSNNIGLDALRKRVKAKLDGVPEEAPEENAPAAAKAKSRAEIEQEIRNHMYTEKMKLVRCVVHNLNPINNDLPGTIITIGNKYLGTVRRMIPFGRETHIEQVLYDDLVSRRYQHISSREKNGRIEVQTRTVPEYNIEVLPALTPEELSELALKQAAAERVGV